MKCEAWIFNSISYEKRTPETDSHYKNSSSQNCFTHDSMHAAFFFNTRQRSGWSLCLSRVRVPD